MTDEVCEVRISNWRAGARRVLVRFDDPADAAACDVVLCDVVQSLIAALAAESGGYEVGVIEGASLALICRSGECGEWVRIPVDPCNSTDDRRYVSLHIGNARGLRGVLDMMIDGATT